MIDGKSETKHSKSEKGTDAKVYDTIKEGFFGVLYVILYHDEKSKKVHKGV